MSIVEGYRFEPMVGDPDDHRPDTFWALLVDPGDDAGRVEDLAVISERIAPAGVPHGFHNDGDGPLPVQAVFPTARVWIRTLERNPAPGTEGDPPQPGATYDFRTGDVEFDAS